MTLNPFHGTALFLCSLEASGNLYFPDVFQCHEMAESYFWQIFQQNVDMHACSITQHAFLANVDMHACSITQHAFLAPICTGSLTDSRDINFQYFLISDLSWFQGVPWLLPVDIQDNQLKQKSFLL